MYLVSLKPKSGEFDALSYFSDISDDLLLPNFVLKTTYNSYKKGVPSQLRGVPYEIEAIKSKHTGPALLDTRNLNTEDLSELENLELDKKFSILYQLKHLIASPSMSDKMTYIRISSNEIETLSQEWIFKNTKLLPKNVIIDFGYIKTIPSKTEIEKVTRVINVLTSNTIFITSGTIPLSLNGVSTSETYHLPRIEKQLYSLLQSQTNNTLMYGDYSTTTPLDTPPFPAAAVIQIKYTLENEYIFVRKGTRKFKNITSVCEDLMNIPKFNVNHCGGDEKISSILASNGVSPGSITNWVTIGITHHIQTCLDETN